MGSAAPVIMASSALLGSSINASAQLRAGSANAATLRQNADLSEMAAADAVNRGGYMAGVRLMKGGQEAATQKSRYAAAGVDLGSRSALDVMSDTRALADFDAKMLSATAVRQAWGYQVEASQARRKANLTEDEAQYGAISSMLGGVGRAVGAAAGGMQPIHVVDGPIDGSWGDSRYIQE